MTSYGIDWFNGAVSYLHYSVINASVMMIPFIRSLMK
jgi:hypothetical protein